MMNMRRLGWYFGVLVWMMFLDIVFCRCLYAQSGGRFSLKIENKDLPTALKLVEKYGGKSIIFSYNETEKYMVSADIENKTEAEAIGVVLSGTHLIYQERDDYFVVRRKGDTSSFIEIGGKVKDENGKPLPYVNVLLLSAVDSAFIKGCVTDALGSFRMVAPSGMSYLLKSSFVGYSTNVTEYDGGYKEITLVPDVQMLGEVVVDGQRPLVENSSDGLKVNVAGSFLSKMGTAAELILHLPFVSGYGGSYNVLGRGTPVIYVNNRKIRNSDELNNISAVDIQSAEVVTSPGVEYASDVPAVIRIRTVRRKGEGWSGNANVFYSQGRWATGNEYAALNYRVKGLDIFGKISFDQNNSYGKVENRNVLYGDSEWDVNQNDIQTKRRRYFSADIGFDYEPSPNHSFGARYMPGGSLKGMNNNIESNIDVYKDGSIYESCFNSTESRGLHDSSHSVNSYYAGSFNGWTLNVDADFLYQNNSVMQRSFTDGQEDMWSKSDVRNSLYAVKAVASGEVWKGRLSFGTENTYTDRRDVFTQSGFAYNADDHVEQVLLSAFANYSVSLNKWSFDLGGRYEYQKVSYYEFGLKKDEQSPVYNHFVPAVSVRWADKSFKFGFSYKIYKRNPSYEFLRSSIDYRSKYQYVQGSPLLQPSTFHNFNMNFGWKWINADFIYGDTKNMFVDMIMPYDENTHPGTLLFKHMSIASRVANAVLSFSPRIGLWQTVFTGNILLQYPEVDEQIIESDKHEPFFMFNWDNSFDFPKGWMLNVNAWLQLDGQSSYMIMKRSGGISARLVKSFLNDALTVTLSADDILRTGFYYFNLYGVNSYMENKIYRDFQRVGIRISYKFNATKNKYKGVGAGQSEKSRL